MCVISNREQGFMAAQQKTSWYSSLSPSTKKSWFQIISTLLITFIIVGGLACLENEQKENKSQISPEIAKQSEIDKKCEYKFNIPTVICLISDSKLLGQLQNVGVLSAAILFFCDTFDRKKQLERQAWQLIDGAQGSETSGARRQAIEELYKEGADITSLDADGADLRGINLSGANLTGASFKNAILKEANFEGAILKEANFTRADLEKANFKGANLWSADLTGADLCEASLEGTNLSKAVLIKANLCRANFGKYEDKKNKKNGYTKLNASKLIRANIQNVNFTEVDISGVSFAGAKTGNKPLDISILRQAKDNSYKGACYDEDFIKSYPNEKLNPDKDYEEQEQKRKNRDEKIKQIKNRIFMPLPDKNNQSDLLILLDALIEILSEPGQESNINLRDEAITITDEHKKIDDDEKQIFSYELSKKENLDKLQQDAHEKSRNLHEENANLFKKLKQPEDTDI
jgi:uncharacterized protein YjbI with pentapeptide repeats